MVQFNYFILQLEDVGKDNIVPEWYFSKLKLLKNCFRSTMSQSRLNSLLIMTIENDVSEKANFQNVLNNFVSKNVKNVNI